MTSVKSLFFQILIKRLWLYSLYLTIVICDLCIVNYICIIQNFIAEFYGSKVNKLLKLQGVKLDRGNTFVPFVL